VDENNINLENQVDIIKINTFVATYTRTEEMNLNRASLITSNNNIDNLLIYLSDQTLKMCPTFHLPILTDKSF
jgi:hypothetical protein